MRVSDSKGFLLLLLLFSMLSCRPRGQRVEGAHESPKLDTRKEHELDSPEAEDGGAMPHPPSFELKWIVLGNMKLLGFDIADNSSGEFFEYKLCPLKIHSCFRGRLSLGMRIFPDLASGVYELSLRSCRRSRGKDRRDLCGPKSSQSLTYVSQEDASLKSSLQGISELNGQLADEGKAIYRLFQEAQAARLGLPPKNAFDLEVDHYILLGQRALISAVTSDFFRLMSERRISLKPAPTETKPLGTPGKKATETGEESNQKGLETKLRALEDELSKLKISLDEAKKNTAAPQNDRPLLISLGGVMMLLGAMGAAVSLSLYFGNNLGDEVESNLKQSLQEMNKASFKSLKNLLASVGGYRRVIKAEDFTQGRSADSFVYVTEQGKTISLQREQISTGEFIFRQVLSGSSERPILFVQDGKAYYEVQNGLVIRDKADSPKEGDRDPRSVSASRKTIEIDDKVLILNFPGQRNALPMISKDIVDDMRLKWNEAVREGKDLSNWDRKTPLLDQEGRLWQHPRADYDPSLYAETVRFFDVPDSHEYPESIRKKRVYFEDGKIAWFDKGWTGTFGTGGWFGYTKQPVGFLKQNQETLFSIGDWLKGGSAQTAATLAGNRNPGYLRWKDGRYFGSRLDPRFAKMTHHLTWQEEQTEEALKRANLGEIRKEQRALGRLGGMMSALFVGAGITMIAFGYRDQKNEDSIGLSPRALGEDEPILRALMAREKKILSLHRERGALRTLVEKRLMSQGLSVPADPSWASAIAPMDRQNPSQ